MKVFDGSACRLGNAIFRYLASSLFCIIYKAERTYNENDCDFVITEDFYKHWCNNILEKKQILMINNSNYKFTGFYQTDIYKLFRNDLLVWCEQHTNDSVNCADSPNIRYRIGDLLSEINSEKMYDVVVHIRLEDFVTSGEKLIIHPESISKILDTLNCDKICFVSNKITTEFENNYMNFFKNKYNHKFDLIFESNDSVTDFKIMNNAKILICSLSTLCWMAGFLSKKIEKVYFPKNRFPGWHNQSFTTITNNTQTYDNVLCNEKELDIFLKNYTI